MNKFICKTLLSATVTGALILASSPLQASPSVKEGEILPRDYRISLEFDFPSDEEVPKTSVGGGVRGNVEFDLPGDSASPRTSIGGGSRGDVEFDLPGDSASPRTSIGGGSRGDVEFDLPGDSARPRTSIGGGSRGDVEFDLPGDSARPRTSIGGGSRGSKLPLTALLPPTKHGYTVSPRPTLFVYMPPLGATEVFFSLQDEQGNSHYHTTLKSSGQEGVISITLPEAAPELKIGQNYLWYLAPIEPDGILRPDNYSVSGWVKRVKSTVSNQGSSKSAIALATEYAKAGIWYDTLEVLVTAQRLDPDNITLANEWKDLLEQVGLDAIATQPMGEQL
ncbi:DUF928 domain-containing protein [Moorena producens JHB]|uniref:DUF928 domain-containing protein n=1 Tax=Moorena producens (strain JHB) TaxID=1454205 RepID=A0A1D9G0J4_MOOP1|nr:DUF928 domain-containing protein [Moorena producens]AOY81034.1 DUF928 domain-containing protein [Moorena producens JHB]